MSSSEELSQYEETSSKTSKSARHTSQDNSRSVIPRDMYGLFGVHVSNLPANISEKLLNKTFSSVGKVAVCKIMEPRPRPSIQSDSCPIYAFVKFSSSKEAHDALSKFDGYTLNDSTLAVRPAYVSERRRNHSPNPRHSDTLSRESGSSRNTKQKDETPRTCYVMGSSDCRLRDGRLQDSDVMLYNGTSTKSSPKKGNGGRELAPRFRKATSPNDATHDSNKFRGVSPEVPSASTAPRHHRANERSVISGEQTSPGHHHNSTDSSLSTNSSAFQPYQGTSGMSKQLPEADGMQQYGTSEDGVTQMTSNLSHVRLSPSSHSTAENYPQKSDVLSWRMDVPQGVTRNPPPHGGMGVTYSNSRDKLAACPSRSHHASYSVASWSTADVVQFFCNTDCAEYASFFQEQEIDGRALMLLNRDTLLQFLKVGPALKVLQLIDELRSHGSSPVTGANGW